MDFGCAVCSKRSRRCYKVRASNRYAWVLTFFFPFSSTDQTVRLWDLEESPVTCVTILSQTTPIWGVSWHPDTLPQIRENSVSTQMMAPGHRFITASDDGVIRLYRSAGASASE